MPNTELANFLNVALDVQASPYEGIHVGGGVAAATDSYMLVVARWNEAFLRGEGTISPKTARIIAAMAESTYVGRIEININRVTLQARSTRYEERVGEVAGDFKIVELPEFYCRQFPVERLVRVLTDAEGGWAPLAEKPNLKLLRTLSAKDYVALSGLFGEGDALFVPAVGDETWRYSVSQLRRGLKLFGNNSRLSVRRNAKGWLAFDDQFGYTFAVTPFIKRD